MICSERRGLRHMMPMSEERGEERERLRTEETKGRDVTFRGWLLQWTALHTAFRRIATSPISPKPKPLDEPVMIHITLLIIALWRSLIV